MVDSSRVGGGVVGRDAGRLEGAAATVARFRQRFLEKIAAGEFDLPMLPEIASMVMAATQDDNCDAKRLSKLIHRDASLAGNVLKLANSPLYAPAAPIVSLQQAVSRLGMKRIREIALVAACQARLFKAPGHDRRVHDVFRHSIAAAAFAQEIARMRRWNVEEAFLCGLLHDAGKPVLLQLLSDVERELDVSAEEGVVDDILQELHGVVGGQLVESWKLPARLAETIACHHAPHDAEAAGQSAMMTSVADDLAHFALGTRPVTEEQLRSHPMLAPLNLYRDELETLMALTPSVKATADAIA
jgi:putative nucleotidyltransferase with HDIG domain